MQRIRSPKTKRLINVNGDAYKKLLKEGYTLDDLLNAPQDITIKNVTTIDTPQDIKNNDIPIIPEDAIREILYHADFNTIKSYCLSKSYQQVCHDVNFWKFIFNRDNLPIINIVKTAKEWIQEYQKIKSARREAEQLESVGYLIGYNFVIENKRHFDVYITNQYPILKTNSNFFAQSDVINDGFKLIQVYKIYNHVLYDRHFIIMKSNEFIDLLTLILYFQPDVHIYTLKKSLPLRPRDIINHINIKGSKTLVKQILLEYKKYK